MRQRDAKFVPQVSFSSAWQLPVQTALNAQKSTLPMTIQFVFADQSNWIFRRKNSLNCFFTLLFSVYLFPTNNGDSALL